MQQEKIATCEGCKREKYRRNDMYATYKSATWNGAMHKKSATRKKVQHEKITTLKSATEKWCSIK